MKSKAKNKKKIKSKLNDLKKDTSKTKKDVKEEVVVEEKPVKKTTRTRKTTVKKEEPVKKTTRKTTVKKVEEPEKKVTKRKTTKEEPKKTTTRKRTTTPKKTITKKKTTKKTSIKKEVKKQNKTNYIGLLVFALVVLINVTIIARLHIPKNKPIFPILSIKYIYLEDTKVVIEYSLTGYDENDRVYCMITTSEDEPSINNQSWVLSNNNRCEYYLDSNIYHVFIKGKNNKIIKVDGNEKIGTIKNLNTI